MNPRVVLAVALTTFREFWRTPEAMFWTYGFPLLMSIGLGLAFQPRTPPPVPVAVVAGDGPGSEALAAELQKSPELEVSVLAPAAAERALVRGRVGLLVRGSVAEPVLREDPARPEARLARLCVERALREARDGPGVVVAREVEDRPGSRYIDFLIPGLVGLNLLGAGMWGIGFRLVEMRSQNLLRRLFVTPLQRGDFLFGYMLGRFVLVIPESAAIVLVNMAMWGVPVRGSWFALLLLVIVGGLAFSGLGCLCAARVRTIEGIMGLMNACSLPMWVVGGALFANEEFKGVMHWAAEAMPLTHLCRALRDVMLEPGGLVDVAWPLAGLAAFALACFGLALRLFRWD